MQRRICWVCLVVVAIAVAGVARDVTAQETPRAPEPAGYLQLIEAGLKEYYDHHFVEARALFAQAHALNPNARTLRVLGMTEFELRHYPQSLEHLRAALASTVHPLDADLRARTQELEKRALSFVGQVFLDVQPSTAEVLVDDAVMPPTAAGTLLLQAGEHTLEVRAATYRAQRRNLDIKGGEDLKLQIALSRELFPATTVAKTPAQPSATPLYASPWLWTGVGVVLAGTATALLFALRPDSKTEYASPQDTAQTPVGARIAALGGP
jgi:hypothetical protein